MATRMQVTIDCADPGRLARFWATALGYRLEEPPDGFASWQEYWVSRGLPPEEVEDGYDSIVDPDGVGPRVWFQPVPEAKVVKNRVHLDLDVGGGRTAPLAERRRRVDAEADRLVAAGATRFRVLSEEGVDHYGVVMQDPEGNEFCLH
ncbi:MAG TPA: VOC family protein [Actinomycetota bacterium]|jgi:catechol 2,3-dioxygenase-like lactoylglutathione lyase family enzyme|nr:VOC family protein [Actinomycetota bacterium]